MKKADGINLVDFLIDLKRYGKINNKTKKQMIEILRDKGYEDIYPTYIPDESIKEDLY